MVVRFAPRARMGRSGPRLLSLDAGVTGAARILVEIGSNGLLRSGLHKVGRGKIGKTLPQVNRIVLNRQCRVLGKDRCAKATHTLRGLKGRAG